MTTQVLWYHYWELDHMTSHYAANKHMIWLLWRKDWLSSWSDIRWNTPLRMLLIFWILLLMISVCSWLLDNIIEGKNKNWSLVMTRCLNPPLACARISCRSRFMCQRLRFLCSFLLVACKLRGKWPMVFRSAPSWKTQRKLLASEQLSSGHCSQLESGPKDEKTSSLYLFSVNLPFQKKTTNWSITFLKGNKD